MQEKINEKDPRFAPGLGKKEFIIGTRKPPVNAKDDVFCSKDNWYQKTIFSIEKKSTLAKDKNNNNGYQIGATSQVRHSLQSFQSVATQARKLIMIFRLR